jgi:hypothetical protein
MMRDFPEFSIEPAEKSQRFLVPGETQIVCKVSETRQRIRQTGRDTHGGYRLHHSELLL